MAEWKFIKFFSAARKHLVIGQGVEGLWWYHNQSGKKMFYICCCLYAHYCMLFSDLWPVYITLIGKLMLRKVLISLWHQFIGHDMTCEVCDSKHLCSFHFIFQHCSFILTFQGLDFASKHQYVFRVKIAPLLKQVITRANSCFVPILIFMQLKNWFSPRSNHPLVQEKHLANSCVFSCGEQGGPIGRRLGGKDCKEAANVCHISPKTKFSVFLYKSWN